MPQFTEQDNFFLSKRVIVRLQMGVALHVLSNLIPQFGNKHKFVMWTFISFWPFG